MAELSQANQYVYFDELLLSENPLQSFDPKFWQVQGKVIGQAHGRGISWFVRGEQLEMVLRHYYRGGLFSRVIRDQYWYTGNEATRSVAEFMLLRHLHQAGVPVPRPVAAHVVRHGCFYQADILVERIAAARDLVAILQEKTLSDTAWQQVGRAIKKMHCAGVCHTDLNAHNILLDNQNKVWLIDFDKCSIRSNGPWKQMNLSRLQRSLRKEVQRAQILWHEDDWSTLLQGYRE